MNERIFELAKQAEQYADDTMNSDPAKYDRPGQVKVWRELMQAKFAELIVRECIEQCNVNFVGTVGSHPNAHNRGVKMCIDNIKQHFRVEE